MYKLKYLIVLLLTISFIVGCGNANEKQRVSDNGNIKEETMSERKIQELTELQIELKNLAAEYIIAEYKGDETTLLKITSEEAYQAVKNGELEGFTRHEFEEIVSYNFLESNSNYKQQVIVAVSSIEPGAPTSTIYFENISFKKLGDRWLIVKVERDA